jgi:hypothetical protein
VVAYAATNKVVGSDGYLYTAAQDNSGVDPVSDDGTNWTNTNQPIAWRSEPEIYGASNDWLPVYCGLRNVELDALMLNIGTSVSASASIFRRPAGFLREARLTPLLRVRRPDHEEFGDYFSSTDGPVITMNFCADITKVKRMDAMFCEGLAAHMGIEACEPLTQSRGKIADIVSKYKQYMSDARAVNAIEQGPEEPDEDDWITIRY